MSVFPIDELKEESELTARQREAEHRESLASTIQNLRASESQQTIEIVSAHYMSGLGIHTHDSLFSGTIEIEKYRISSIRGLGRGPTACLESEYVQHRSNGSEIEGGAAKDEDDCATSPRAVCERHSKKGYRVTKIKVSFE
jgi:hypothetical protein